MKFSFTIIFVCWSTLSIANDIQISSEFPNYMNECEHLCKNEIISFNFTNAKIISIGRDFISSPWITCLNFSNIHLQSIEKGAFNNPYSTDHCNYIAATLQCCKLQCNITKTLQKYRATKYQHTCSNMTLIFRKYCKIQFLYNFNNKIL